MPVRGSGHVARATVSRSRDEQEGLEHVADALAGGPRLARRTRDQLPGDGGVGGEARFAVEKKEAGACSLLPPGRTFRARASEFGIIQRPLNQLPHCLGSRCERLACRHSSMRSRRLTDIGVMTRSVFGSSSFLLRIMDQLRQCINYATDIMVLLACGSHHRL